MNVTGARPAAYYTGNRRFSLEEVGPREPGPGEVRVEVAFCGICGTDLHVYLGHMDARIGDHRVIGHEMSGTVDAVGGDVEGWDVGDRVVVRPLDPCGECPSCRRGHAHVCQRLLFLGLDTDGAFQRWWNVPAHTLHRVPDALPLELAALIEPTAVACHDVRRGGLAAGEDALVIGGGPIGMLVALVARGVGANVTVSEINEHRLAMAESLGFATVNPKEGDPAKALTAATGGKGMDVVFEVSGTQPGVDLMTAVAAVRGRIVMVAIHATKPEIDLFQFFWKEVELYGARVYEPEDYDGAIDFVAANAETVRSLVTSVRPLVELQGAFEELAGNPKAMKTLIRCSEETA